MPHFFLFILFLFFATVSAEDVFSENPAYDNHLFKERWLSSPNSHLSANFSGVSGPCQDDIGRWINHTIAFAVEFELCIVKKSKLCTKQQKKNLEKNVYALKQLDAFGRLPPGLLDLKTVSYGSPEECKEVSQHFVYETKFCFLSSTLGGQKCGGNGPLKTAVCMPKSCSEQDITEIFSALSIGILNYCSTECVKDKVETNAFTWVFTTFMGILLCFVLLGSVVDYVLEYCYGKPSKDLKNKGLQALTAFSIFTNGAQILDTQPAREGHLKSLDCIRFFSMLWVVSGHVFNFWFSNNTLLPILKLPKAFLNTTFLNAWFSVDTFFVLSGLLVSYMFFKTATKNPKVVKNPFTWVLFYVHRILRLSPPYMLFIGFFIVFFPLVSKGPIATLLDPREEIVGFCKKNWWQNLLYINNFNKVDPCYGITWYLACDTQMYLAAPIVLITLFINHFAGIAAILAIGTGSVIACMVLMIENNVPASPTFPDKSDTMQVLYNAPWIRCTPYLVGMYTGYILAKYRKLRMNKFLILVCWCLAIAMGLSIIYGPYDYFKMTTHWSKGVRAFYYSFSRIGWGIFVSWIIVANHYGWAGPISSFMCHPLWQPLGRLSYTAYLVHIFCVFYYIYLSDIPPHYTSVIQQFFSFTLPVTTIAYIFAFFWSSLCELPFMKLEKMLVDGLMSRGRRRESEKIEKSEKTEEIEENWGGEESTNEKL